MEWEGCMGKEGLVSALGICEISASCWRGISRNKKRGLRAWDAMIAGHDWNRSKETSNT